MTYKSTSNITPLPINQLQPNSWNPNQMTDTEFKELVEEVRRLGRVPKPIIVRPLGDRYEIIDGEHNWYAAEEVGLTELPCEVIEADDFEAMLQTYKRNQHGQHSPVLEGRLFRQMRERKGIGNRELAQAAGVSEGTIRNRMCYARAADLRNCYAGENRDAGVDGLQVRQVRTYVDLPQPLRDMWLDAGGQMELLGNHKDQPGHIGLLFQRYALTKYLDAQDFRDSFGRLAELCEWLEQNKDVADAAEFVQPIAEMQLPGLIAWIIPVWPNSDPKEICIDLESWRKILQTVRGRVGIPEDVTMDVASAVYEELEDLDIDPWQVYKRGVVGTIEILLETPDYIREAHRLTLQERVQLHHATAPAPPDVIEDAKRATVAAISKERLAASAGGSNHHSDLADVMAVFFGKVRTFLDDQGHVIEPRCFDRDKVLRSLEAVFQWCPRLRDASVAGRSAFERFRNRMAELRTPELVTMRALLHGALPSLALGEWIDAVHAELSGDTTENENGMETSGNSTAAE